MKVEVTKRFYNLIFKRYIDAGEIIEIPQKQYYHYKKYYKEVKEPVAKLKKPNKKRGGE